IYLDWEIHFIDVEAAQKFLPLDIHPGETYKDAQYRTRLPEDREACDLHGMASIRAGRSYQQEFRCHAADGRIHWIREHVQVETLEAGQRWSAVGVCTDITERKEAEEALARANEFRNKALESAIMAVGALDMEGRF